MSEKVFGLTVPGSVKYGPFGSVAEHSLGKGEVAGPIPAMGTSLGCVDNAFLVVTR